MVKFCMLFRRRNRKFLSVEPLIYKRNELGAGLGEFQHWKMRNAGVIVSIPLISVRFFAILLACTNRGPNALSANARYPSSTGEPTTAKRDDSAVKTATRRSQSNPNHAKSVPRRKSSSPNCWKRGSASKRLHGQPTRPRERSITCLKKDNKRPKQRPTHCRTEAGCSGIG